MGEDHAGTATLQCEANCYDRLPNISIYTPAPNEENNNTQGITPSDEESKIFTEIDKEANGTKKYGKLS